MKLQDASFATKAIHAGCEPDTATGSVITPIYQTSTYSQLKPGEHKGFDYSRSGNPTRSALEKCLAELEGVKFGFAFASGMAAADAIMKLLKPGDEVIASLDLYGGSFRMFTQVFAKYGIEFKFTDLNDVEALDTLVTDRTKMIWLETPSNPMCRVIDIEMVSMISKKHDLVLVVDNTFASPFLQNPVEFGADIVMHSATKYLGGHSDVVLGAVVTDDEKIAEQIKFIQNTCGAIAGPNDSWLVLRGIKTLHLRMERHCLNAEKIATFLKSHPAVNSVFWPGYSEGEDYQVVVRQMKNGFGGMLSFTLNDDSKETAFRVLESFEIFSLAESLGGVESLVGHPSTMTHASVPEETRERLGITNSMIRMSVGIEDAEDLIKDLNQALSFI